MSLTSTFISTDNSVSLIEITTFALPTAIAVKRPLLTVTTSGFLLSHEIGAPSVYVALTLNVCPTSNVTFL